MKNLIFILTFSLALAACDSLTTDTKTGDKDATVDSNNPITKSLLEMRQKEQSLQNKIDEASDQFGDEQALFELDEQQQKMYVEHFAALEKMIGDEGWISQKKYGEEASLQALTILKNAPPNQLDKHLSLVLDAAKNGEANLAEVAFIHDKVLMHRSEKQLYGTQIAFNEKKGINDVYPIKDPANVDKRRAEVGLEPLAEALKKMGIEYWIKVASNE